MLFIFCLETGGLSPVGLKWNRLDRVSKLLDWIGLNWVLKIGPMDNSEWPRSCAILDHLTMMPHALLSPIWCIEMRGRPGSRRQWLVGGVAQWLGRRSLAGGPSLTSARSMVYMKPLRM